MIKITDATARIREQHDWCARTAGCAFQRHVTEFDVEAIDGRRMRFKERRLGGSRTSAGYEARSGSCRCAGEQVTARQSCFGHLIHSLTAWILWSIPRDRPKRSCPSWLTEGEHRPKFNVLTAAAARFIAPNRATASKTLKSAASIAILYRLLGIARGEHHPEALLGEQASERAPFA